MIRKRSVTVAGHKTSISLEGAFWQGLRDIAEDHHTSLPRLIARIDGDRQQSANLSSAIRMFVVRHFRDQVHQQGRSVTDVSSKKEEPSALGTPTGQVERPSSIDGDPIKKQLHREVDGSPA